MRSRASIIPKMMSQWWESLERPHRLFDQYFGMGVNPAERLLRSSLWDRTPTTTALPSALPSLFQPWEEFMRETMREALRDTLKDETARGSSVVKADKDKFQVALDVQQFKPDEITVKVVDDCVVVEGKHEEKRDDHGYIARHFVRRYIIPEQCDPEKTTSTLSADGILTITAPRKPEAIEEKKEKTVPIEHTGKPAIEEKGPEEKES